MSTQLKCHANAMIMTYHAVISRRHYDGFFQQAPPNQNICCYCTHGARSNGYSINRATLAAASWMSSGNICAKLHHACGRSSYSTSSTGRLRAASRFSSSCDASIVRSPVPTKINVLGQDAVKGRKAADTSGSVDATPVSPTYALDSPFTMGTVRISVSAFALARLLR